MTTDTAEQTVEVTDVTGKMRVIDASGDTTITWDKNKPDEVAVARQHFDTLVGAKKYLAYKQEGETRGEVVRTFDPNVESLVLVPQTVGG